MGQIVGGAAKPKRCNLNKLSQLETPAAGEYILVSSDNSMNAAGQGNFDCYIMGDGTTAATALPLNRLIDFRPVKNSKQSISSGGMYQILYEDVAEKVDYNIEITESGSPTGGVRLNDLSAFENGKTYKITLLAKETANILLRTINSSNAKVQDIAAYNTLITNGQTYTWNWTKQNDETKIVCISSSGRSFKCEFTISHQEEVEGIVGKVNSLLILAQNMGESIGNLRQELALTIVYIGDSQTGLADGDVWFYSYIKTLYKKSGSTNIEMPSNTLCVYNGSRYLYIKGEELVNLDTTPTVLLANNLSQELNQEVSYIGSDPNEVASGSVFFYTPTQTLRIKNSAGGSAEMPTPCLVKYNGSRYLYIKGKELVNLYHSQETFNVDNGKNKYNWRTCINGFLQKNNTINTGYTGYATSAIIPIKKDTNYTISHTQSYEIYDADMVSLSYKVSNSADDTFNFNSGGAAYLRVSTNKAYYRSTQVEEGDTVTSFELYTVPTIRGGNCLSSHISLFAGKKYISLGDSVTERGHYQEELSYNLGGFSEINNKGVYGRIIRDWLYERNNTELISAEILSQYDLISFGGLANDYNVGTPIGNNEDAPTDATFFGYAKKLCEYLISCCPDKFIIGFGVPQFNYTRGWGAKNEVGATMWDYNEALRKVCEYYAIPFADVLNKCGICEINKSIYYDSPDFVHPNRLGMKRMADIIASTIVPMQNRLDQMFV